MGRKAFSAQGESFFNILYLFVVMYTALMKSPLIFITYKMKGF